MKRLVSMIILTSTLLTMVCPPLQLEASKNVNTVENTTAGVSRALSDSINSEISKANTPNTNAGISKTVSDSIRDTDNEPTKEKKEKEVVQQAPVEEQLSPDVITLNSNMAVYNEMNNGNNDLQFKVLGRSFETLSASEFNLLCHLIMAEAEGENDAAQRAVGETVLNRIECSAFPNDLTSVIWQRNPVQFSPTVDGRIYIQPSEQAINNALHVLVYRNHPKEMLFFTSTNFTRGYTDYMKIDHMYFSLYYGGK